MNLLGCGDVFAKIARACNERPVIVLGVVASPLGTCPMTISEASSRRRAKITSKHPFQFLHPMLNLLFQRDLQESIRLGSRSAATLCLP